MTSPDSTQTSPRLRVQKLTNLRLQLSLTGWFLAAGLFALALQFILTVNRMTDIAMEHAVDPALAFDSARGMTQRALVFAVAVTVPLTIVLGILVTARFAGPLHRFTRFLEATARGEAPPDCKLRKGDHLQARPPRGLLRALERGDAPRAHSGECRSPHGRRLAARGLTHSFSGPNRTRPPCSLRPRRRPAPSSANRRAGVRMRAAEESPDEGAALGPARLLDVL